MKSSPQSSASSSRRIPLQIALLLLMLLAVGVGVGSVGYLLQQSGRETALRLAQKINRKVNDHIEDTLKSYLQVPIQINDVNQDAVDWGFLPDLVTLKPTDLVFLEGYFARQLQRFPEADYIGFVSADGGFVMAQRMEGSIWVYNTGGPLPGEVRGRELDPKTGDPTGETRQLGFMDVREQPWFAETVQTEGISRSQTISSIFSEPQLLVLTGLPLTSKNGTSYGSLAAAISIHNVQALLDTLDQTNPGISFLLDSQGQVVAGYGARLISEHEDPESSHPILRAVVPALAEQFGSLSAVTSEVFFRLPVGGEPHLIEIDSIQDEWGLDFYLVRGIPESEILGAVNRSAQQAGLLGGGILLGLLGIGMGLTECFARPIRRLTQTVKGFIPDGSHPWPKLDPGPIQEVQTLNSAWERMVAAQQAMLNQLRQQEQDYREVVEQQSELICRYSLDTRLRLVNEAYLRFFGQTREECLGTRWSDTIPETERDPLLAELIALNPTQPTRTSERIYSDPEGKTRYVHWVDQGLFDDQGQLVEILSVGREITQQKLMERALEESEERFRTLVEDLNVGVLLQGRQAEMLLCNPKALELLDLTEDQLLGRTSFDPAWNVIHEDGSSFPGTEHPVPKAIVTGQPVRNVVMGVYRPRLQDRVWLLVNAKPRLDEQGQVYQVICTFTDITLRIQAEEALKQTQQTLHLQAERERLLGRITERIRRSLDLMEILQIAATEVRQLLQTDRVVIYLLQPDGSSSIQAESVSQAEFSIVNQTILDSYFFSLRKDYFPCNQVHSISDIEDAPIQPYHVDLLRSLQVHASLVVAICGDNHPQLESPSKSDIQGILIAHQCRGVYQWQDWEKSILVQLSEQLSVALQQAELYQQVQNLNNHLEALAELRTARLQQALDFEAVLHSISSKVVASLDEAEILNTVVQELVKILGLLDCSFGFFSKDCSTLKLYYAYSPNLVGQSYDLQEIVDASFLSSLQQGKVIHHCFYNPTNRLWATLLNCPILDEDQRLMGLLNLERLPEQFFVEPEIQMVQQVANLCALAIRQARLYEAAQAQVTELEQLNLLKDDFVSTVSHELRTPMTNVRMALRMMQITTDPQKRQNYFMTALQECERQIALINDLLDIQRLEAEGYSLKAEEINLVYYLQELLSGLQPLAQSKQQLLQLHLSQGIPILETDSACLSRVLRELVHNAIKYTAPEGAIHIRLTSDQDGFLFMISNSAEISQSELARIFDKFYRIPQSDRWKHGGTGLGLALVKQLVMRMGGDISVKSSEGWTHFQVWLPQNLAAATAHPAS
ncbi:PAS domain S-box protein [Synechococcus sp. Nb3U1]|uniref:PAS domain S-box protein n=1 Tax=Synechococcus sp. Nb3U1 TaxID=1914529 RepID=UPI001F363AA6|nr:PAS domain S-box protein [Synechococcus sp. Nb3U1]MCF2972046.1 PAS domain S-box protein [Synechococcus sp. Nb3U1]